MKEFAIDLSGVTAREDLHLRLREALPLPEWYGDNLDALYDALTDFDDPAIICISGWESLQEALPSYFIRFARVLEDASAQTEGLFVSFETEEEPEEEAFQEADTEDFREFGEEADGLAETEESKESGTETDEEDFRESGEEADESAETEESEESGTETDEEETEGEDRTYEKAESAREADAGREDVEEEV